MRKAIDRTGERYGMLTVVCRADSIKGRPFFKCLCDCGNISAVRGDHLTSGHTVSCGCYTTSHLKSRTPEYRSWAAMMNRCNNRNVRAYQNYGGRGVSVCNRWRDFTAFLEDMGPRPSPGHSIDRIDNNGNYEPGNCRWATKIEQARNTRRSVMVEVAGEFVNLSEVAKRTGLSRSTISKRFKRSTVVIDAPSRAPGSRKKT